MSARPPGPASPPGPPAVTVIGCDGGPLPPAAVAVLSGAAAVAGARRHLDTVGVPPAAERIVITRLDAALDAIWACKGPVAVLASGDPGFFGIVRGLRARGAAPGVIPAVSSVALAFGRLGLDWDDALVLSAHGRETRPVLAAALAHPKVAVLTGPPEAETGRLRSELLAAGRRVFVAERLGAPGERVREVAGDPADVVTDPHLLIVLARPAAVAGDGGGPAAGTEGSAAGAEGPARWLAGHQGAPSGWALPEEDFAHRDSMITKAEVRALVLARLGPGPGRTVWDIGAGSGSVAVECARFGAWAVAVESDPDQCARIHRNAAAHGVLLRVVAGRAPDALSGLPAPDAVFAGGGDDDVLAAAVRAGRPGRVVVTLASVDRVRGVCERLSGLGYRADGTQLQAARLAGLPGGSLRLAAVNPVFVIWADRAGTQVTDGADFAADSTANHDRAGFSAPSAENSTRSGDRPEGPRGDRPERPGGGRPRESGAQS
ncbi:MAG TPA: precorrin-6y C5,15-methyltransferase (decarboxylating) subunit CbiE [Streptosporangiaceae bacterium]